MLFPFRAELNELFQSDRRIWWKMLGGFAVGAVAAVMSFKSESNRQDANEFTAVELAALVVGFGVAGSVAVIFLSLKDVVERRMDDGEHVNVFLKIYLGCGGASLVAWFVTAIVGTFLWLAATL